MEGINTQHTTRPKSTQLCMSKAIGEEEKEEEDEEKGRENRRHLMAYKYIVVIKCKRNTYHRLRLLLRDSGQGPKQSLADKSLTRISPTTVLHPTTTHTATLTQCLLWSLPEGYPSDLSLNKKYIMLLQTEMTADRYTIDVPLRDWFLQHFS